MTGFGQGDYSDGPTMIMSPTSDPQASSNGFQPLSFSGIPQSKSFTLVQSYCNNSTSWTPADSTTPISTNPSRKRSREETDLLTSHDGSYFPSPQVDSQAPIPKEAVYGKGMVFLNPVTDISVSTKSQTGIWVEKKFEPECYLGSTTDDRPTLPSSRKSVRLDSTAPPPSRLEDTAAAIAPPSPPKAWPSRPTIDDFTYALGIGWTRLTSEDPDVQAAARGWAKYLENHYAGHVHKAEILLQSKGLNAYLVGSQEGFYLFSEDLLQGRLVGRSWDTCLNNLRSHPITFEENDVLRASRTPDLGSGFIHGVSGHSLMRGTTVNGSAAGAGEHMEMD